MSLRVVFMGTPDFAVPTLEAIAAAGHEVAAVYSRAPALSGRGMKRRLSPVHEAAERLGVAVETPARLRDPDAAETLARYRPDVVVVVAYGLILPQPILDVPRLGCLNVHASLLPRWRGAAPIQRAVMAGDTETGVALMRMEEGLDTGPVAMTERVPISPDATAGELHDILAARGATLMAQALSDLEAGRLAFSPQPEDGVTYAGKIANAEARLDWYQPARELHDRVRGLSPFPGAFFEVDLGRGPERLKVLRATTVAGAGEPGTLLDDAGAVACGVGALRLLQVQPAGRRPMGFADFARGARLTSGAVLA